MPAGDTCSPKIYKIRLSTLYKSISLPRIFVNYQGKGVGWEILFSSLPKTIPTLWGLTSELSQYEKSQQTYETNVRVVDFTGKVGVEVSIPSRQACKQLQVGILLYSSLKSLELPTTIGFSWPSTMIPGSRSPS